MRRSRVAVIGAGGQAKIIVDALVREGLHEVVGYLDDERPEGSLWYGHPVLGPLSDLPEICRTHGVDGGIVSVGDNYTRGQIVGRVDAALPGFTWVRAVHPSAQVAQGCTLGPGVLLMAGAVVNPDSSVGAHSTLDTRASLDHDSSLAEFSSLAPNVATGGGCTIGRFTAVAIGSAVAHGRTIGEHTVIGAGSVVVRDIPDRVVAYGSPAKVVRSRTPGEPYL